MKKIHFNWFNVLPVVLAFLAGMRLENFRVWKDIELTWWVGAGYAAIVLLGGAFLLLIFMALKAKKNNANADKMVIAAAVIGLVEGVLVTLFFTTVDIDWGDMLLGLGLGLVLAIILALSVLTLWVHPKSPDKRHGLVP
ncbi:MAG: hypothetical protein U5L95_05335 [Candidatus Saccharibacteria bacterium]|nr:hypothetical protein [Candidatus Saccharibacteria bacterium]